MPYVTVRLFGCCLLAAILPACAIDSGGDIVREVSGRLSAVKPPLGGHQVEVDYRGRGIVSLAGWVDTPKDRERIAALAREVRGVVAVDNGLEVVGTASSRPRAMEGAETERFFSGLRRRLVGRFYSVEVIGEGESTRVSGTVDTEQTKQTVLEVASEVFGRAFTSEVILAKPPRDEEVLIAVKREVTHRIPDIGERVTVTKVERGVVSVEGDLTNHLEVDRLLATVVMVPGVTDIKSGLTINGEPYAVTGHLPTSAYNRK
jgi:osmotically-inducible protein OsmY